MTRRAQITVTSKSIVEVDLPDDYDLHRDPLNQLGLLGKSDRFNVEASRALYANSVEAYAELIEEPKPITLLSIHHPDESVTFSTHSLNGDRPVDAVHFEVFAFISPRDGKSVVQIDSNEHHPNIRITLNEHDLFDGNTEDHE